MNINDAIRILSKYEPCPHDNYDTRMGDGTTWAECEDCGETFRMENLQMIRRSAEEYKEAIDVLFAIKRAVE